MTYQKNYEMAHRLAEAVQQAGGRAYFVGGAIRDRLLGRENKDLDIEVHGILPDTLAAILDGLGERLTIGANFGIFGLRGYDIDVAMPRKEEATGRGHRDFAIFVDPYLGTAAAAERRDFTVNAMMQDILTEEILDPFGGKEDLKKGLLRHVSTKSFPEDPLRVLRAAQFAARFGFTVAEETEELCRHIDLSSLPRERIDGELTKALLQAEHPSVFFRTLKKMGQLSYWFPEAEALIGVEQDKRHHAEGDVFTHTMMVLDAAVKFRGQVKNPKGFMLSALTHDFGKPATTTHEGDRIRSIGHEIAGIPLAKAFITRLTGETVLCAYVENMTRLHMRLNILCFDRASLKASNKLLDESVAPFDLACLGISDSLGMIHERPYVNMDDEIFARVKHYEEVMARPFVQGKDLTDAGLTPGKDFSDDLAFAHKLRLAEVPKEQALAQTLAYARSHSAGADSPKNIVKKEK